MAAVPPPVPPPGVPPPVQPPAPPPRVMTVQHGPPLWNGMTALQIRNLILSDDWVKPCFGSERRAWRTLGYGYFIHERPPDDAAMFHSEFQSLWGFLHSEDNTALGHTVRAYLLDALDVLGWSTHAYTTDQKHIQLFPLARQAHYDGLPAPGGKTTIKEDKTNITNYIHPTAGNISRVNNFPDEYWQHYLRDQATFENYHRFRGFCAIQKSVDANGNEVKSFRYFKGVPVPHTPDSLWQAVAWWRGSRRRMGLPNGTWGSRSTYSGYHVKARIFTYFMQTIKDQDAVRFKDYWKLQQLSKTADDEFGELSLIRSLHASPSQGRPAYPTWWDGIPDPDPKNTALKDGILHVIADYFCTQVIVFHVSPVLYDPHFNARVVPGTAEHRERIHFDAQKARRRWRTNNIHGTLTAGDWPPGATPYFVRAYGEFDPLEEQIWLVTSDWIHFDAVEEDHVLCRQYGYFPPEPNTDHPPRVFPPVPPPLPPYPPPGHGPPDFTNPVMPPSEIINRPFNVLQHEVTRMPWPWWVGANANPPFLAYRPNDPIVANRIQPYRNAKFNIMVPSRLARRVPFPLHDTPVGAVPFHSFEQINMGGMWARTNAQEPACLDWTGQGIRYFMEGKDYPGGNFEEPSDTEIDSWRTTWRRQPTEPVYTFAPLDQWQLRFGPRLFTSTRKGNMGMEVPFYRYKPKYGFENY